MVVPHNHTILLQEGTYLIEELVPEDFVKADWRIGWYGECERGDTFFTTVTIDDGNIDHGTLYCQADNQYRPENNPDHDEEVAVSSSRTKRGGSSRVLGERTRSYTSSEATASTTATSSVVVTVTQEVSATTTEDTEAASDTSKVSALSPSHL